MCVFLAKRVTCSVKLGEKDGGAETTTRQYKKYVPTHNQIMYIVDCPYSFPPNRAVTVVTATGNEPWQRIQGNTRTEVREGRE